MSCLLGLNNGWRWAAECAGYLVESPGRRGSAGLRPSGPGSRPPIPGRRAPPQRDLPHCPLSASTSPGPPPIRYPLGGRHDRRNLADRAGYRAGRPSDHRRRLIISLLLLPRLSAASPCTSVTAASMVGVFAATLVTEVTPTGADRYPANGLANVFSSTNCEHMSPRRGGNR